MSHGSAALTVGAQLVYDGDLVRMVEFDEAQVTVGVERTGGFRTAGIGALVAACRSVPVPTVDSEGPAAATVLAGLSERQRAEVAVRAR